MTSDLLRAAAALAAILLGGAGLSGLLGESLAFAFPAGLAVLELASLRAPPGVALTLLLLCAPLALLSPKGARPPRARVPVAALALLAVFAALLATIALCDPWIDSDAANHHRWVGLARLIREQGVPAGPRGDPLGPSLAVAFVAAFLSRWRDQAASLLWVAVWLSIVALGFALTATARARRGEQAPAEPGPSGEAPLSGPLAEPLSALLVCAFATAPLLLAHVVRPGFAELLLTLFLLAGVALLERHEALGARRWALLLLLALGLANTKLEGKAWALWLLLAALTRALHGRFRARTLAASWAAAGALGIALHLAVGQRLEPAAGAADDRIRWPFEHHWAPQALLRFAADALSASSFSLLWWWTLAAALWLAARGSARDRLWLVLAAAPLAAVFYFCCFTGNVAHTLIGTDVSRFLLQVSPLALLLLLRWARSLGAEGADAPRA